MHGVLHIGSLPRELRVDHKHIDESISINNITT